MTRFLLSLLLIAACLACAPVYYKVNEAAGRGKRELIEAEARYALKRLTHFEEECRGAEAAVSEFLSGEENQDELIRSFERAEHRAEQINDSFSDLTEIADDLIAEWEERLEDEREIRGRGRSAIELERTRQEFEALEAQMELADERIGRRLAAVHDAALLAEFESPSKARQRLRESDELTRTAALFEEEAEVLRDQLRALIEP